MMSIRSVALVALIVLVPKPSKAIQTWISVAHRVELADAVVVGRVGLFEPNKRVVLEYDQPGEADLKRTGHRQRWLNVATIEISEVLKGNVDAWPTVTVVSPGMFEMPNQPPGRLWMSSEDRHREFQDTQEKIWFLQRAGFNEYSIEDLGAFPISSLNEVKECAFKLNSRYQFEKPGLAIDERSWVIPVNCTGTKIAVGLDGTIYLTGVVRQEVRFEDGFPPIETGAFARFSARALQDGTFIWKSAADCDPGTMITDIVVDTNGQFTVAVLHDGQQDFGSYWLPDSSGGAVIEHYDHAGRFKWFLPISGMSDNGGRSVSQISIATRKAGAIVVGCSFRGRVQVGEFDFEYAQNSNILLAEIDVEGRPQWVRPIASSSSDDICTEVEVSARGNIIVGGSSKPARNGAQRQTDAIIVACSPSGGAEWRYVSQDSTSTSVEAVAVDSHGGVVASIKHSNVETNSSVSSLHKWNRKGELKWAVPGGGSDVTIGPNDDIVATGSYGLGSSPVPGLPPPLGDKDIYVQCFTPTGKLIWTMRDGGMGAEGGRYVDVVRGRIILSGGYDGTTFIAGKVVADFEPRQYSSFVVSIPFPRR